ncbi:MAG: hypothetical protein LAN59_14910, partial [Acidobacteriia bacterium]|nr:hypothetical protein [Terriglobia bacterium]
DAAGRKCLCNALMANIGHAQTRQGKYTEQGLVTSGDDLTEIARFLPPGATTYTAADVVAKLLGPLPQPADEPLLPAEVTAAQS